MVIHFPGHEAGFILLCGGGYTIGKPRLKSVAYSGLIAKKKK